MGQPKYLGVLTVAVGFIIAAGGCTVVSNQLGKRQAAELLSSAKVAAICHDGKSTFVQAPCDRAFCLGPLAMEVAVSEEQVTCCPDQPKGRCPSAKFVQPPSPIVQVPSHEGVRSILGGKGQGLNCSIPWYIEPLFFDPNQFGTHNGTQAAPLSLQFAQACYAHDMCYRHGAATYGYQKADCDDLLFDQTYRLCTSIYRSRVQVAQSNRDEKDAIQTCKAQAGTVYLGVAKFGKRSFQPLGQSTFFEFDPMARATRASFRVSRLSLHRDAASPDGRDLVHYRFGPDNVSMRIQNGQWKTLGGVDDDRLRQMPAPRPSARIERSSSETESYFVAQRDVLRNTGTRIMVLPKGGTTVVELHHPPDKREDEAFDCNSAVHLPVSSSEGVSMFTFGIAALDNDRERCPPFIAQGSSSIKISPVRLDALANANYYRLQQLEPMLGRFGTAGEPHLLMLARGVVHARGSAPEGAAQAKSSRGDGYKQKATAFTVSLDGKTRGTQRVYIPEVKLPVAPFLRESALRDGLLSLHAASSSNGVKVSFWQPPGSDKETTWSETGVSVPGLTGSWLEMPAQVLAGRNGDSVVVTRVSFINGHTAHTNQPNVVNLQFQALSLSAEGAWRRIACSKKSVPMASLTPNEPKVFRVKPETAWHNVQAIPFWSSDDTISVFFVPHPGEEMQQLLQAQVGSGVKPDNCEFA